MNYQRLPILLTEDDPLLAQSYTNIIKDHAPIIHASRLHEAMELLSHCSPTHQTYSLAIVDLHLGNHAQEGLKIVSLCYELGIPTFVLSSSNQSESIESAYLNGCLHFLNKMEVKDELGHYLTQFYHSLEKNINNLFEKQFITQNQKLKNSIIDLINQNLSNQCIFISGDTGSGKSHLANFIHDNQRFNGDFISLHCGEISEQLMESELFGHAKGAFTGAEKNYLGRLRKSHLGTLFLDEVGTLSANVQVKLLKAIDEKMVIPVGSNESHKIQFTLISATWEDLSEKISQGKFREDLWYRIMGHLIHIPPLSERRDDIFLLLNHFMEKSPRKFFLSHDAKDKLLNYEWPGNVRELQKIVKRLSFLSKGIVKADDIILNKNSTLLNEKKINPVVDPILPELDLDYVRQIGLGAYLELIESQYVKHCIETQKSSITQTMKELKISAARFYRIQKSLGDVTRH
ncbi:MAG: sigma 54-interacting transcriptional regulator [Bacteriovoracaceae bacterium]|nr:sigma 54-interacting transcriptional regulator [Bacteriovoracaceae bacterium]